MYACFRRHPLLVGRKQKKKVMTRSHLFHRIPFDLERNTVCLHTILSTWPTVTMRSCGGRQEPQTAFFQCCNRLSGKLQNFEIVSIFLKKIMLCSLILAFRNHCGSVVRGHLPALRRACIPERSLRHKDRQTDPNRFIVP